MRCPCCRAQMKTNTAGCYRCLACMCVVLIGRIEPREEATPVSHPHWPALTELDAPEPAAGDR